MSNETARLAREWAENIDPLLLNERARAAAEHILATTPPLTMADAVWNDEKHHLAGATTPSGIEVVMVRPAPNAHHIVTGGGLYARDMLTPNGKRYELREIGATAEPEHPATLVTEQDYENAPEGTTVAEPGYTAWTKVYDGNWWRGDEDNTSHWMAGTKRDVLRRGWGK